MTRQILFWFERFFSKQLSLFWSGRFFYGGRDSFK